MHIAFRILAMAIAMACCGCAFERHYSIVPGQDQVLEVESGDRWFMELDERDNIDCEWQCEVDDDDVEVEIAHDSGKAKVTIQIHRGYDGPTTLNFYRRRQQSASAPYFVITLFKRTGDEAFWK